MSDSSSRCRVDFRPANEYEQTNARSRFCRELKVHFLVETWCCPVVFPWAAQPGVTFRRPRPCLPDQALSPVARRHHLCLGSPSCPPDAYRFAPDEAPTSPGAPYVPRHTARKRLAYGIVGTLIGISTNFPNALTNINVGTISGSLGLYVAQVSWLPAIYYALNASANLTLVKARLQFGIPAVTHGLLIAYAIVTAIQLAVREFSAALLVRAVNGLTAATLVTLGVYYFLQVLPAKLRPLALLIGISLPQLSTPLARLVPVELLAVHRWQGLHLLELAVALGVLACVAFLPLPPNQRSKAFEPLDLLTIGLIVPAMLLC
jgi:hypothetical protein